MRLRDRARRQLEGLEHQGLERRLRVVAERTASRLQVDGRACLDFCSNDYLGLATDEGLAAALQQAVAQHGSGSGASRLVSGTHALHAMAEQALARFAGQQTAALFSSGYAANVGMLSALTESGDAVFSDALNHASLIDGARLSRAEVHVYRHSDLEHLEALLAARRTKVNAALVVTDALFSMDGDRAQVLELRALCDRYDAALVVDEAHALGVLGPDGRGVCAEAGVTPDVYVGTLGKALGLWGAFVAADEVLIRLLHHRARSFVYSTAPPPALAAATLQALAIVNERGEEPRKRLQDLSRRVRQRIRALGFDVPDGDTPIVPVMVGDAAQAVALSHQLLELGIFAQAIRPPTVPKGTSRIRLTVSAAHSEDEIEQLLNAFGSIASPASSARTQVHPTTQRTAPRRRLFVTGTGTEVGKTIVTRALALALHDAGQKVAAIKPVETGCAPDADDAAGLAAACGRPELADAPGLYRAQRPAAPLAATRAGEQPPPGPAELAGHVLAAAQEADWLLVEGAGGLLVPLDERNTMAELAQALRAELVVVAPDVLGTLSHTLTVIESARARKLPIACVVLNRCNESEPPAPHSNLAILRKRLAPIPVVAFPACKTQEQDDLRRRGTRLLAEMS